MLGGDAGIGKSTLLRYAADTAPDLLVLPTSGVESEMGFVDAGFYDVVTPLADHLDTLPSPQRTAHDAVLGRSIAPPSTPLGLWRRVVPPVVEARLGNE